MKVVNCGAGEFVLLESVICPECGPRLWTTFEEDAKQTPIYFPAVVRTDFVRQWGPCATCGGQVLLATSPLNDGWGYADLGERIVYSGGGECDLYEFVSDINAVMEGAH